MSNVNPQTTVQLELLGEAKDVVAELSRRYGMTEGDVVARALGLLWWLDEEVKNGGHVSVKNQDGEIRSVNVRSTSGDVNAG